MKHPALLHNDSLEKKCKPKNCNFENANEIQLRFSLLNKMKKIVVPTTEFS